MEDPCTGSRLTSIRKMIVLLASFRGRLIVLAVRFSVRLLEQTTPAQKTDVSAQDTFLVCLSAQSRQKNRSRSVSTPGGIGFTSNIAFRFSAHPVHILPASHAVYIAVFVGAVETGTLEASLAANLLIFIRPKPVAGPT